MLVLMNRGKQVAKKVRPTDAVVLPLLEARLRADDSQQVTDFVIYLCRITDCVSHFPPQNFPKSATQSKQGGLESRFGHSEPDRQLLIR